MKRMLVVVAFIAQAAAAQAPTGFAAVDSATVARMAWRNANAALQRGDVSSARTEIARASSAWPTQDAYVWGRVAIALRLGDSAGVVAALDAYAAAGFGRDVGADARFAPYAAVRGFADAAARVAGNVQPMANSSIRATLPDSTFWPEGMDVDTTSGRIFISSVRHGVIAELDRRGRHVRTFAPRHTRRIGAVLGVRYDAARGVLWATTAGLRQSAGFQPGDTVIAALLRIRVSDGTVEQRWDLTPSAAGHTLGDIAVAANGDVYTSDSSEPVLYRLRAGADTLERIEHPLFRSLQGIAPTVDGRTVYVADWSHGLLRVDLASRRVTRLADAPGSSSLGCDGLVLYRGSLIAVQNGSSPRRIMRFTLDAAGDRITRAEVVDRNTAIADEPTIGAIVGDEFVYVANSQWDKYGDDGTRVAGPALARPVLLAVKLR